MPEPEKDGLKKNKTEPKPNLINSFDCAIKGIIHTFKTQRSMRIHFFVALIVLTIGLFLDIERIDLIALVFTILLVFITEILNTVVENMSNLIENKYNPVIKNIKDMAAGMVFLASLNAVVVGYLIFFKKKFFGYDLTIPLLDKVRDASEHIIIICLIIMFILIIAVKSIVGKGSPLRGGMPSFHSAFAFAVATMTAFITHNVVLIGMTLITAVLIAESRHREGIHTILEVTAGGALGVLITTLMFQVFS